jgi:hypothetical protein
MQSTNRKYNLPAGNAKNRPEMPSYAVGFISDAFFAFPRRKKSIRQESFIKILLIDPER